MGHTYFWLIIFILVILIITFLSGALIISIHEDVQELTRQIKKIQERQDSWRHWTS